MYQEDAIENKLASQLTIVGGGGPVSAGVCPGHAAAMEPSRKNSLMPWMVGDDGVASRHDGSICMTAALPKMVQ
jgi:hypothetical protein